jgi:hypothetical protein
MVYVRDWLQLSPALDEFIEITGIQKRSAKITLCDLLADRKIGVQATVAADMFDSVRTVADQNIEIPSHLKPKDFDWKASRPLNLWSIGPRPWRAEERHAFARRLRQITRLELRAIDVIGWAKKLSKQGEPTAERMLESTTDKMSTTAEKMAEPTAEKMPESTTDKVPTTAEKMAEPTAEKMPETTTEKIVWRQQSEIEYENRLNTFPSGSYPTRQEDEKWGRDKGIDRDRIRGFREKFIPATHRKGGAPKKQTRTEPGQK